MAYFTAKTFATRNEAVAHIERRGFRLLGNDTFSRSCDNIQTYVHVGPCRTGQWLITTTPPPSPSSHTQKLVLVFEEISEWLKLSGSSSSRRKTSGNTDNVEITKRRLETRKQGDNGEEIEI